jgi:hypothetical protein
MKQVLYYIIGGISFILFITLIVAFIIETVKALPTLFLTIIVIGLFAIAAIIIDKLFKSQK